MTGLLKGIRVLDLTNVLAGPFCCHQLAHFGAEVIKIEMRGRGDLARQLGPDPDLNRRLMGASFLAQNAGKKSITLDLKHPEGRDILKRLVNKADVVVENFRPGVMDRLGLGWEVLHDVKPSLVYCAISGFGQDGPWANRPAYDQIIQGISGVMSITGHEDSGPLRVGYPIADTVGGLTAALAICAALNDRENGAFIDVSMLEAMLATTGWVVSNWLVAGERPGRHGNDNITSSPSGTFQAADGSINIAANKQSQWEALARHIGRSDLLDDPDFFTRDDRKANRARLQKEIEQAISNRKADELVQKLVELGVPAGPVLEIPDVLEHEIVTGRGLVGDYPNVPGVERDLRLLRTGAKIDGRTPSVSRPPPRLGEHTAEILAELDIGSEELARLEEEGVI